MPHRSRLAAALVGLGVLLLAWTVRAQRVALVRPPDNDALLLEVFNRLSAELRLQDFEVAILDTGVEVRTADALADVARRTFSVAAVRFVRRGESTAVDVWFGARGGSPTVVQTIEPPVGVDTPNVLAIRTVDLLRTTLREFAAGQRPPPATPPEARPPPAPPRPPERPPNWKIRAEGIMLWNRPTLGLAFGAALGLTRRLAEHVELGLTAAGPVVVGRNWATTEGEATVHHQIGWAELRFSGWSVGPLEVGASAGAGALRMVVQGVRPADLSRGDQVWSFATTLAGHAEIPLGGNAAIGMTLRAIGLTPRPAVEVGSSVAVIQFPLLGASAGLLVGF
jgi:hypothetical protein